MCAFEFPLAGRTAAYQKHLFTQKSTEENPCLESNSRSSGQEIPRLLWVAWVHCCAHLNLQSLLSWAVDVSLHCPVFFIYDPFIYAYVQWSLIVRFFECNFIRTPLLPAHLITLDFITLIVFGVEQKLKLLLSNLPFPAVDFSLLVSEFSSAFLFSLASLICVVLETKFQTCACAYIWYR